MLEPCSALTLPDRPSIAVLPFADETGSFEQQSFADGVTDHITYTLACTRGLFVSGRNSAFAYKGRCVRPQDVGRVLGVRYLLEGTIARTGDRLGVGARVSETETGRTLWSERFEGDAEALFDVQNEIVGRVMAVIGPGIPFDRSLIRRSRISGDIGIYAKFLSAFSNYCAGSEEGVRSSIGSLQSIARIVPEHPLPIALIGQCYTNLVVQGWSRDVAGDAAEGTRLARLAIAGNHAEDPAVMMMTGHTLAVLGRDYETAVALLDRSLERNPNSSAAYERSGWVRCYVGRPDLAAAHFRAARRLSPLDNTLFRFHSGLGTAHGMLGEHEDAVLWSCRAIADAPDWTSSHRTLAASLAHLQRDAEARRAAGHLLALEPDFGIADAMRLYQPSPGRTVLVEGLRRAGLPD